MEAGVDAVGNTRDVASGFYFSIKSPVDITKHKTSNFI